MPSYLMEKTFDILKIQAPAKVNIRLKVIGRRKDGYHELVSIMVPVGLVDHIEVKKADSGISLSCQGISVPDNEENLAYKAASEFFSITGINPAVSIKLSKNIPVAAGLGGGSSDAAAILNALNRMYEEPLSMGVLSNIAVGLGADVPFFLQPRPYLARGIGEVLDPIKKWPNFQYVIVNPPIKVSTAWVYANLKLELTIDEYNFIVRHLEEDRLELKAVLENDLEKVTVSHFPVITEIKKSLINAGAKGALMTGSGPSVFGIFESKDMAISAGQSLRSQDLGDIFVAAPWGTA